MSWSITGSTFTGQPGHRPTAPTRRARDAPAGATAGRSTSTATASPSPCATRSCEDNVAREGGGAIFFVSNDRTGTATLAASTLRHNPSLGFETRGLPGIFFLGARRPALTDGTRLIR